MLARFLEARGYLAGALRVLHRNGTCAAERQLYGSTFYREKGRIAERVGDVVVAAQAGQLSRPVLPRPASPPAAAAAACAGA
jgi:hypothetical protein